jgi:hypothetical protein
MAPAVSKTQKTTAKKINKKTEKIEKESVENTQPVAEKQEEKVIEEKVEEKPEETVEEKTEEEKAEEEKKEEETPDKGKKKKEYSIYYNNQIIDKAKTTGSPKAAALKALTIIFKHFFTKEKQIDLTQIGKEIKFFIEEKKTHKRYFYIGMRDYIVHSESEKKPFIAGVTKRGTEKKPVIYETDANGIIGIVSEHVDKAGKVIKIVHKYINTVKQDVESYKNYMEELNAKKQENKKPRKQTKKEDKKEEVVEAK